MLKYMYYIHRSNIMKSKILTIAIIIAIIAALSAMWYFLMVYPSYTGLYIPNYP